MQTKKRIILFQFLGSNKQFYEKSGDDNRNQYIEDLRIDFLQNGFIPEPFGEQDLKDVEAILFFDLHSVFPIYGNFFKKLKFFIFNLIRKDTTSRNIFKEEKKINKKIKKYLLAFEPKIICEDNFNPIYAALFNQTFSWSNQCCGGKSKNINIKLPIPDVSYKEIKFNKFNQKKLLVTVSSNKGSFKKGSLCEFKYEAYESLYRELGEKFDLYGYMWDQSFLEWFLKFIRGSKSRYFFKLPSYYKDAIKDKDEVLSNYKFCLTIENMSEYSFITEKIFNAINAGSIPIYFGAPNVSDFIPKGCYLDLREFDDFHHLSKYILNFTDKDYLKFLHSREEFLKSYQYKKFTSKSFKKIVTTSIYKDILFE